VIVLMVQPCIHWPAIRDVPEVWIFEALTGPNSSVAFMRAVNRGTEEFFSALFIVGALYVSYAPLALVLEVGACGVVRDRVSPRPGNWLWLSGIAPRLVGGPAVFFATIGLLATDLSHAWI